MKKRSIVIVSPNGSPARTVKISYFAVIFSCAFALFGLAAYFIPAKTFNLDLGQVGQKKEYDKQNEILHRKIQSALRMLDRAKDQIGRLKARKDHVALLAPVNVAKPAAASIDARGGSDEEYAVPPLRAELRHIDSIFGLYGQILGRDNNPFDHIPVCNPVAGAWSIVRHFGMQRDPFSGQEKPHRGIDVAAQAGTPVIATASGVVVSVDNSALWGKRVVVEHGHGLHTVYAHLGAAQTGKGRKVKRGEVIGIVGATGFSTGPHVHYEVWRDNKAIDPERLIFSL